MAIADADWVRHVYNYDPETGAWTWRNPPVARGRSMPSKPAGRTDERRDTVMLRLGGKDYPATNLAWLYVHGEWADRQVHFRDAELPLPTKNRIANLYLFGDSADLTADKLREALSYDPLTGDFKWKVLRRGVKAGMPAGTLKLINGKMWRYIRVDGVEHSAGRLAWLLHYGEWPSARLEFKDGDASNTRIANIIEGRFSHGTRQDAPLTQEEREIRRKAKFRRHDLKRHFDLTDEEFAEKLEAQNGVCASCGRGETAIFRGRVKEMQVDHDHALGNTREAVRDILCGNCNASMGAVKDNISRMVDVLLYRARWAKEGELRTIRTRIAELLAMCDGNIVSLERRRG